MPLPALAYPIMAGLAAYGPRLAPYANRAANQVSKLMPRVDLLTKDVPWKQAVIGAGIEEGITKGLAGISDIPENYLDAVNNTVNVLTGLSPRKAVTGLAIDISQLPFNGVAEASTGENILQATPSPQSIFDTYYRQQLLDQTANTINR